MLKFEMTLGTNSGYDHGNFKYPLSDMGAIYQLIQEEIRIKTGVVVSANISRQRTVYPMQFGCPKSGEHTFSISGIHNAEFSKEKDWIESVELITKKLKEYFKQNTVSLTFIKLDKFNYYKD